MQTSIKLSLLAAIVVVSTSVGMVINYAKNATTNPPISSSTVAATQSKPSKATAGGDTQGAVKSASIVVPAITSAQACTPSQLAPMPGTPAISVNDPGLHESPLAVAEYQIFGNTLDELRRQASSCAPVMADGNRFSANTSYSIRWTFNLKFNEASQCVVNNVSVGLGISQQYPVWQASPNAAAGLASVWQDYKNDLIGHEMGHVDLARSHAAAILNNIRSYPAGDCSTIVDSINAAAQNDLNQLNAANHDYDATTGHGATQGASL